MPKAAIPESSQERILTADPKETDAQLAKELGIAEITVRKYRSRARKTRREATQRVIEQRIDAEIPNALDALGFVLRTARAEYEATKEVPHGRLLKDAAVDLMRYGGVVPEKDPLGDTPDAELIEEALRRAGRLLGG